MKHRSQAGFTIIELVIVIVILGILAAVALPRFMDATERAHDTSVLATKAALAESVALFRAQWYVNGNALGDAENDVRNFGDGNVDSNTSGFPIGSAIVQDPNADNEWGDAGALDSMTDITCAEVWEALVGSQPPVVTQAQTPASKAGEGTGYTADVSIAGSTTVVTNGNLCTYTYLDDLNNDDGAGPVGARIITYNVSNGDVDTNAQLPLAEEGN